MCVCVFVVTEARSDCAEASAEARHGQLLAVFGRKDMRGKPGSWHSWNRSFQVHMLDTPFWLGWGFAALAPILGTC